MPSLLAPKLEGSSKPPFCRNKGSEEKEETERQRVERRNGDLVSTKDLANLLSIEAHTSKLGQVDTWRIRAGWLGRQGTRGEGEKARPNHSSWIRWGQGKS